MIDVIKKAILAGVGAAALTKEKVEDALGDLVEKGKLSASDAKDAAKKIADEGKQEFESASAKVQEKFDDLMSKASRRQGERIDALETRVAELEARLGEKETASSE
jgi:polyhydroxyalkanoate synthesis regulator phasin